MVKYKIVKTEPKAEVGEEPIVELRLVMVRDSYPTIQGRNPDGSWHDIGFFSGSGKFAKKITASNIQGIAVDGYDHIETY